jgi:hypothetical protein
MPLCPITPSRYEVMKPGRWWCTRWPMAQGSGCGARTLSSRPSGTDVDLRYEATACTAGYLTFDLGQKEESQSRWEKQAVATPARSGTQVTAVISLNQTARPRRKGIGERKLVLPGLAQRVQSRRALLHALYPEHPEQCKSNTASRG